MPADARRRARREHLQRFQPETPVDPEILQMFAELQGTPRLKTNGRGGRMASLEELTKDDRVILGCPMGVGHGCSYIASCDGGVCLQVELAERLRH